MAILAALIAGGLVTAYLVKQHNDQVASETRKAAAARADALAKRQAAEQTATAAAAQQAADDAERKSRRELIKFLEQTITKDAKKSVTDGILDGPILHTSCTATGGGSEDDLTALTGTFECIAVNKKDPDGTESGYRYSGTTEWNSGQITWKLGG
jgi:hypothetical protein